MASEASIKESALLKEVHWDKSDDESPICGSLS